jgi:hypothetical protein
LFAFLPRSGAATAAAQQQRPRPADGAAPTPEMEPAARA